MNEATASPSAAPAIIPRPAHTISRAQISPQALKVLYRLKDAGYQAFLVGGGVRDLLLGREPKDFDVATDALPEEIRRVFRNCRLIGRRFRLAHVHFGDEIIEVATFRAAAAPEEVDDEDHREIDDARAHDESGRILRDNVYGTIDEDVWRRDFTANALYYNIADFSVWDYVGGVADVQARVLRLIGDPETRFREDPVRLLRAARFAAKLGFTIHRDTRTPMQPLAPLLAGVPPARLFDESNKLFLAGHGVESFAALREFDLLPHLFPAVYEDLEREPDGVVARLLAAGLESTDARVAANRSVTPTFLFAVLLYGPIVRLAREKRAGAPDPQALADAADVVIQQQIKRVAVPKRFTLPLRELIALQPRFERRDGRRALALLQHPRFRAAYDLLVLRAHAGDAPAELANWWTEIQELPAEERQQRVAAVTASQHADEPDGAEPAADGAPPRRRRRRGGRNRQSHA
ncbi:MAG: polynucleotide adenylyltransferase PcnB [Steroidobacteraceae bacterium]|nr:polynucleotide adenylyltransferase PcnB [Steroidobacteraceae bacterium]